ncbi:MAG: hypothetical protein WAO09_09405 [Candidatus Dormiibacterota bacterium]
MTASREFGPAGAHVQLLLDVVQAELRAQRCPACGHRMGGSRLSWLGVDLDQVTLQVTCRSCGSTRSATASPGAEGGVADLR